jgi:CRISPR/Cas system-associated protein Cas5 (RAMP superfamily)
MCIESSPLDSSSIASSSHYIHSLQVRPFSTVIGVLIQFLGAGEKTLSSFSCEFWYIERIGGLDREAVEVREVGLKYHHIHPGSLTF